LFAGLDSYTLNGGLGRPSYSKGLLSMQWQQFRVLGLLCLVTGLCLLVPAGCTRPSVKDPELKPPALPNVRFKDITARAGINFTHANGAFGKRLLPETFGSGVAFLDYDNDGNQDLLLINSCAWPGHEDKDKPAPTLKLYRNKGDGTFEDVTKEAGLDLTLYGMGVTAGDFDNDGYIDLFITALGGCRLLHNVAGPDGQRRFVDVTERAGGFAPGGGWATKGDFLERDEPIDFPTSATFVDYDKDGLLDIFVCNYVTWSPRVDLSLPFAFKGVDRAYGMPQQFKGTYCQLFRNFGNGKFRDVSEQANIKVKDKNGEPVGKSLGVVACDVDGDGWPDIVVANDTERNFLFRNRGDGTFEEQGQRVGLAYAEGTKARGGMGIDWGQYRPDRFAIYIGNFADEPDSLFRRVDSTELLFLDVAMSEGIGAPSRPTLTFGVFFFDYDLDGRLDVLCCNGHLEPDIHLVKSGQTHMQPAQLFWNTGDEKRTYELVTETAAGPDLFVPLVGRGCAFGDIDGDGYPDIVLTANGGPVRLLHNEGGAGHHWIRLSLKGDGKKVNCSAIGATVTLHAGGQVLHRQVTSGRGYLSQSELPITFGLGKLDKFDKIEIRWPGKDIPPQIITNLEIDKTHVIEINAN
jgi:hypothetical protein